MEDVKIVTIDGIEYQIRKLSAIQQFHMARKIGRCFSNLIQTQDKNEQINALINNISEMKDDLAEDILFTLLQGIYRKEPKGLGWSSLTKNKMIQYDDLDLFVLGNLAIESIKINLSSFMKHISNLEAMSHLLKQQMQKSQN